MQNPSLPMPPNPLLDLFRIQANSPGSVILESTQLRRRNGRFSVMAFDPFLLLTSRGREVTILTSQGTRSFDGDPLDVLQELLSRHTPADSFYGPGAFGYLSYELGYQIQGLSRHPKDDVELPDLWFAFYDEILTYDHFKNKLECIGKRKEPPIPHEWLKHRSQQKPVLENVSPSVYLDCFQSAMENIRAGNIYQVNLCRRFSTPCTKNPWDIYAELRITHPTAYSAYANTGQNIIVSASPELFLRKEGDHVETHPIKGTARKLADPLEEMDSRQRLRTSAKDRAEHIMIVDLERNDLGRICQTGTISPVDLLRLEECAEVNHLVSTVHGKLRKDVGLSKILEATFPGGSVTGAPKRKAMEIIGSLEPVVRGIYTGALGWIGFSGDFILNLPIRTILFQNEMAHICLGSGIVADSTPEKEYQEILAKGAPFFKLLGIETLEPSLA